MRRKMLRLALGGLAAIVVLIQLVPYGRQHTNPPAIREPAWNTPRTRELAARACYDCHSNQTTWPWYSHVAPMSWIIERHVSEGRRTLNFSEWDRPQREAADAAYQVEQGNMPLPLYVPLHPKARLSDEERDALIRGLDATFEPSGRQR